MAEYPYRRGMFVWSRFPFDQDPHRPGPPHIAYVLRVGTCDGQQMAICAYTSSKIEKINPKNPPIGVMYFGPEAARTLEQKPFYMDTKRLAWIPMNKNFFHKIQEPGLGIVKATSKAFQGRVLTVMEEAVKRREGITMLGPYNPMTGRKVTLEERDV